jgi:hypothetical protein
MKEINRVLPEGDHLSADAVHQVRPTTAPRTTDIAVNRWFAQLLMIFHLPACVGMRYVATIIGGLLPLK